MKTYSALITAFAMTLIGNASHAQTVVWTNTSSGGWNTATNWSPNTIPNSNNAVIINQPGVTVSLNGATTAGSISLGTNSGGTVTLSLASQSLTLFGSLTVNSSGSFTVDSGALVGSTNTTLSGIIGWTAGSLGGVLTLGDGCALNISGTTLSMAGAVITNDGTVVWTNGTIQTGNSSVIYNHGLWNMQSDQTIDDAFGGVSVFNNYGTVRKSGGQSEFTNATIFASGVVFNQVAGVIDVQNGTNGTELAFEGGGNFTGGYITTNQFGLTVLSAGTYTVNGTVTGTNTWEDAGNLVGNNVINGALSWVGGSWNSATSLTIAANSTLLIVGGAGDMDMDACQVTNNGTVVWTSGTIQAGNGSIINNSGLWNMQSDQTMNNAYGGVGAVFNNYGTVRKSGGQSEFTNATIFASGVVFNQVAGVIDVQNGTNGTELAFEGGGNFTGGYITTNQFGLTVLSSGNFTVNGTVTGTNTWEDAGNLVGNNVINGALSWVGGNWNSATSVTIAANSTLLIVGGAGDMDMDACQVTNNGTVVWTSGTIQAGNGSIINNSGLWNMPTDQTMNNAYGGVGAVFNNYGTVRKSGGQSEFTNATIFASGVVFNQVAGVIDVQNGTNGTELAFEGGGNFTGGYITTNQFGLTVLSSGNFTVNGTVTGTNTWEDAGNLVGNNVINGALSWVGGSWNSATSVTITTNSTLLIVGGAGDMDMDACQVTNNGTVVWTSGTIQAGNGSIINNNGLWNMPTDQTMNNAYGAAGSVFNNYSTLRKSGGASTNETLFQITTFNQLAGVIDVQTGNLVLQGTENFTGGSTTTNGTTWLSTGNFTINGTITTSNVVDNPGTMVGTNAINGALTWQDGSWNNTVVTVTTNSVLYINTAGDHHELGGVTFTNNGIVDWSQDRLYGGGGTTIYNYGLWNAQDDQILDNNYGGAGTFFNNYGTLRKSGGASTNQTEFLSVNVNQIAGSLDVQTGNMVLAGTENFTGGFVTNTGTTWLSTGNFTINGTVTTSNVVDNPGAMVGNNVINGALTWQDGSWNNAVVTVTTNSVLYINTAGDHHELGGVTFTNKGTVDWSQDRLYGGGGTGIYNYGLWNAQDDQILDNNYGGAGTFFDNIGVFRKTGTTGGSTQLLSGVNFTNTGTLDSQIGNISLQGACNLTNGTLNTGINGPTNYGTISFAGAVGLTGAISANINNNYQPSTGDAFTNIYYGSFAGAFTKFTAPSADLWSTNYNATSFYLRVVSTVPLPMLLQSPQISGGNFGFGFWAVNGQNYTVQDNTNLETTNWIFYTNITGNGTFYQFITPVTNIPALFFRVIQP